MKIKEIRTRVVAMARQDSSFAAAFLHQPHGPAHAPRSVRCKLSRFTAG